MYWINSEQIRKSEEAVPVIDAQPYPQKRWGQACVIANRHLYIIGGYEGQYLGDVWEFDFESLSFREIGIETTNLDKEILKRSNHTAVFYKKLNSIFLFGGGQAQKQRFNDTLKLELKSSIDSKTGKIKVNKIIASKIDLSDGLIPSPRTYHASCLQGKYMVIIGGEATADLKDFWAFDIEQCKWYNPQVAYQDHYTAKRFHTANAISKTQIVTFGGCHSEYVHLNEMHIFQMSSFIQNPLGESSLVVCTKINQTQGIPSTRWGHAASIYNDCLYILGGRNEQDVIDLHEFNFQSSQWREIEVIGQLPKPRRRHSALFISGSLVMFGGFDGSFYNDMNILDFQTSKKSVIKLSPSTMPQDYFSLLYKTDQCDIKFVLDNSDRQLISAHKALVLFRTIEREIKMDLDDLPLSQVLKMASTPQFIKDVYFANSEPIFLKGVTCRATFLKLLEYLYCDRFVDLITIFQVKRVADLCKTLELQNHCTMLKKQVEIASKKTCQQITKEFENCLYQQLDMRQREHIQTKIELSECQVKLDFSQFQDQLVNSPEDKQDRLHQLALCNMNQCKNLDDFYDILFYVEDSLIKANSLVLSVRCPYFQSMLSSRYQFRESTLKNGSQIRVQGVPKMYFQCIIQYIYSDHFYIQKQDAEFFIKLLIYADYFMLPRLVEICSSYIKPFINTKSVLHIMLLAHAHNANQLEQYCTHYLSMNKTEVLASRTYRFFKKQAQESLLHYFQERMQEEEEESYVQICIQNLIQKYSAIKQTQSSITQSQQQYFTSNMKEEVLRTSIGKGIGKEQELDLDNLLATANYIYLEEHQKIENYSCIVSNFKTLNSALQGQQDQKMSQEAFEEEKHESQPSVFQMFNSNKENINLLSNLSGSDQGKQALIGGSVMSMERHKSLKKRELKREPLQEVRDDRNQMMTDQLNKRAKQSDKSEFDQEDPNQSKKTHGVIKKH